MKKQTKTTKKRWKEKAAKQVMKLENEAVFGYMTWKIKNWFISGIGQGLLLSIRCHVET